MRVVSEQLRESLSAAIDDEADEFELRRVLDEARDTPALCEAWDRYHLVSAVLRRDGIWRGEGPMVVGTEEMRARIWAALDNVEAEPVAAAGGGGGGNLALAATGGDAGAAVVPQAAEARGGRLWPGRVTGIAVAAGVAFAVVLGLNGFETTSGPETPEIAITLETPPMVLADEVTESDRRRADAYMLHHAQQKALNQAGVVNFVKVAAYQGE